MKLKRFLAALVTAALVAALALPVGAAGSSFSDVKDAETAVHADMLRLMGVVDGTGDNRFDPDGSLTRAEFCTMVVKFMQKGDQVPLHATRTIFSDVTARHWSLAYVNLAASLKVADGAGEVPLISGVGDGRFLPDARINLAQAATILIRVLGYSSQQAGAVWPQSYMNLAQSIGLTQGVNAGAYDSITRAQAARLFANALSCKTGAGSPYYQTLGQSREEVVLLAVNVLADDGSAQGAVRTSVGTYLPQAENVKPTALQGKRGALVLNDKNEIVTFVPDDSESVTLTLSGDARPTYVKGTDGKQYAVSSDALVYTADREGGEGYISAYTSLRSGSQVTLFSQRGKVVAVYAGGGTTADSQAVVVMGTPSAAMFHSLTGGAGGYTILKNRQPISLSDLQTYDVVTYDALSNALVVSDLRLSCVYEDASPSAQAPETVTALGHDFPVLTGAWDTIQDFDIGDKVTLLLTADGKVAAMVRGSSNAVGLASEGGVEVFLPGGGSIALTGEVKSGAAGQLVTVTSTAKGKLTLNKLSSKTPSGPFDLEAMTLGGLAVAAGVRVYEQAGSALVETGLSQLDMASIPASDIALCHRNTSGVVDVIVLKSVTGDGYIYGRLTEGQQMGGDHVISYTNRTVTVTNGTGGLGELVTAYSFKDGAFGGVAPGTDGRAASVVELTALKKVAPGDFFVSQGVTYLNHEGTLYRVAEDVECYKQAVKSWFQGETGEARLAACKAFSGELTAYVDPVGDKVRVVAAN